MTMWFAADRSMSSVPERDGVVDRHDSIVPSIAEELFRVESTWTSVSTSVQQNSIDGPAIDR